MFDPLCASLQEGIGAAPQHRYQQEAEQLHCNTFTSLSLYRLTSINYQIKILDCGSYLSLNNQTTVYLASVIEDDSDV